MEPFFFGKFLYALHKLRICPASSCSGQRRLKTGPHMHDPVAEPQVMQHVRNLRILRQGLSSHRDWTQVWRSPPLGKRYDVVIIGGGGHGLATAYYLAKRHGIKSVAVLERGWIGGGNSGRNTTIVRSNYFFPSSARIYDLALRLYEELSVELNFNIMLSQRGLLTLAHSEHAFELAARSVNAMLINGIDVELLSAAQSSGRSAAAQLRARRPVPDPWRLYPAARRHRPA